MTILMIFQVRCKVGYRRKPAEAGFLHDLKKYNGKRLFVAAEVGFSPRLGREVNRWSGSMLWLGMSLREA